jgi:hypothetical protein
MHRISDWDGHHIRWQHSNSLTAYSAEMDLLLSQLLFVSVHCSIYLERPVTMNSAASGISSASTNLASVRIDMLRASAAFHVGYICTMQGSFVCEFLLRHTKFKASLRNWSAYLK